MDLGVAMTPEVLEDKLEEAKDRGKSEATWNTRRLPKRLTSGWTNRLFVASGGVWRGYFPLSGEVLWIPEDQQAPYALIIDVRGWTPVDPVPAGTFRSWRHLAEPPSVPRPQSRNQGEVEPQGKPAR